MMQPDPNIAMLLSRPLTSSAESRAVVLEREPFVLERNHFIVLPTANVINGGQAFERCG
jgi:hypothetical protein